MTCAYTDSTYHTKTTKTGSYCCFCFGTNKTESSVLERHTLETDILPQPTNGRFATVEHCIAVNDGVDSELGDDDFSPFRNIMNDTLS